jgi:AcrR family transcriptional regulator
VAGRATYHHGDLRSALVEAALAVIAENGVAALSVAQAARRAGVSTAAPYRHFASRQALLAAAATQAARQLAADLGSAAGQSSAAEQNSAAGPGTTGPSSAVGQAPDSSGRAVDALAATAGAYVRFVVQRRAGFDLIFADELAELNDPDLAEAGRAVIDVLLPLALQITGGDAYAALNLLEQHTASAHGYAALHISGFLRRRAPSIDDIAAKAAAASRVLATAAQQS